MSKGSVGWFAVSRGITSHPLFKGKPERLAVWMWLLDNAVWKATTHDVKGHTIDVPRGSVCASERHISEQCGVGYQVVRTAIKRFKTEHMINTKATHGKNLITLCNYEKYQDPTASDNATPTQPQRNLNAQKEQGNKETREEKKEKRVTAPRISDDDLILILSNSVSPDVAASFVQHRKDLKKPMTENMANAVVKKLEGHHAPDMVLTNSIANGWQGIFPEKITNGGHNGQRNHNGQNQTYTRGDAQFDEARERALRIASRPAEPGFDSF
mgnify:CR=1 FL=1